jgi:hypothetical protein
MRLDAMTRAQKRAIRDPIALPTISISEGVHKPANSIGNIFMGAESSDGGLLRKVLLVAPAAAQIGIGISWHPVAV